MFKRAKRANFRRRNESDEDEHDESQQQQQQHSLAPTAFGPVGVEIPFMETNNTTTAAPSSTDNCHSNGFLANINSVRAVKKEKKGKEAAPLPTPTKPSLLSFDDEEGNLVITNAKVASRLAG